MAHNEHEDYDRQPRWNTVGYWTPRREGEDWQGDRSRARDYNREDMRRYNLRALERGEELRRMRGQGGRRGEWDRQPGNSEAMHGGRWHDERQRDEARAAYDRARRGSERPGPARRPERERFQDEPGRTYPRDRRPGDNLVDNYWGRREMGRDYRVRDRGAWWNNVGGRPDVTSARDYGRDLPTRPDFDWIEDRDYDLDPGYEYEFGTDFDILDDFDREMFGPHGAARPNRQIDLWDEEPNPQPDPRRIVGGFEYGWQGPPHDQRARYREVWNLPGPARPSGRRRR